MAELCSVKLVLFCSFHLSVHLPLSSVLSYIFISKRKWELSEVAVHPSDASL